MNIQELTNKVIQAGLSRTHAQRVELLRKADIIDEDGHFPEKYFSKETIEKDKAVKPPLN